MNISETTFFNKIDVEEIETDDFSSENSYHWVRQNKRQWRANRMKSKMLAQEKKGWGNFRLSNGIKQTEEGGRSC